MLDLDQSHAQGGKDRFYWPEKHAWARLEQDGPVTIGITDVAQHMARGVINPTPKDVGCTVQKGKSAGTLESGKWVGPVTSPISGEIVAVNEAVKARPPLINQDPYGEGWFARLKPVDWQDESAALNMPDRVGERPAVRWTVVTVSSNAGHGQKKVC